MELSKPAKKRYIDVDGIRCPYCNSYDIAAIGPILWNMRGAQQKITCLQCGKEWVDIYTLSDVKEEIEE